VAPNVVPGRDDIGAVIEELAGETGCQAGAVCRVLSVDDTEADPELVP